MCEEMNLDERFLRLLFFDVSEVGKSQICDYRLHYFDANLLKFNHHCHFDSSYLYITGYVFVLFQILVLISVVGFLKRSKKDHSVVADILMVIEEISTVLLVSSGICYCFYTDLLLISLSIYIALNTRRVSLDHISN